MAFMKMSWINKHSLVFCFFCLAYWCWETLFFIYLCWYFISLLSFKDEKRKISTKEIADRLKWPRIFPGMLKKMLYYEDLGVSLFHLIYLLLIWNAWHSVCESRQQASIVKSLCRNAVPSNSDLMILHFTPLNDYCALKWGNPALSIPVEMVKYVQIRQ